MNASQSETPVAAPEERIGKYRVHPVASMFPLMQGEEFDKFKISIQERGQQQPIIVQGDMLIDGRNRMRACVELEIEPIVAEYTSTLEVGRYIMVANLDRRTLTHDQKLAIGSKAIKWMVADRARLRKLEAAKQQGPRGAEGGRGHKKPSHPNSDEGVSKRDTAAENARSTVGQIAEITKTTRHKAAQAVRVIDHAPDLLDQVAKGEMKLKDAHAKVKAAKSPQPPASKPGYLDVKTRLIHRIRHVMKTYPSAQADLRKAIIEALEVRG